MPNPQATLTGREFARAVGVHPDTVSHWVRTGRLPGIARDASGYYQIPASLVPLVLRGELPLAPLRSRARVARAA